MTVITKPKPKTEKCMTECVNDSLLVHTDLPGISLQYKLVATTDPSLPLDEAEHLSTVYSVLIIKSDRDPVETVDETVFVCLPQLRGGTPPALRSRRRLRLAVECKRGYIRLYMRGVSLCSEERRLMQGK